MPGSAVQFQHYEVPSLLSAGVVKVRTELHHKAERIPRTAREEREEPVRPPAERSPSAREKCKERRQVRTEVFIQFGNKLAKSGNGSKPN